VSEYPFFSCCCSTYLYQLAALRGYCLPMNFNAMILYRNMSITGPMNPVFAAAAPTFTSWQHWAAAWAWPWQEERSLA
jgi:hypothetical protein